MELASAVNRWRSASVKPTTLSTLTATLRKGICCSYK